MSKNIIILQHIPIETPGYILDLMIKDNIHFTTIESWVKSLYITISMLECIILFLLIP